MKTPRIGNGHSGRKLPNSELTRDWAPNTSRHAQTQNERLNKAGGYLSVNENLGKHAYTNQEAASTLRDYVERYLKYGKNRKLSEFSDELQTRSQTMLLFCIADMLRDAVSTSTTRVSKIRSTADSEINITEIYSRDLTVSFKSDKVLTHKNNKENFVPGQSSARFPHRPTRRSGTSEHYKQSAYPTGEEAIDSESPPNSTLGWAPFEPEMAVDGRLQAQATALTPADYVWSWRDESVDILPSEIAELESYGHGPTQEMYREPVMVDDGEPIAHQFNLERPNYQRQNSDQG